MDGIRPSIKDKNVDHSLSSGTAQTRTAEETGTYFDDPLAGRVQRADYTIVESSSDFIHTRIDNTGFWQYLEASPPHDDFTHYVLEDRQTNTHGTTTTGSYDEWSDLRTTLNWTRQDYLLNESNYETEKYADGRDGWRNTIHHLETHRPDSGSASGLEYSFVTGWHTDVLTPGDGLGDIWTYVIDPTVNDPPMAPEPAGHFEHWAIVNGAPHDPLTNHDPLPTVGTVTVTTPVDDEDDGEGADLDFSFGISVLGDVSNIQAFDALALGERYRTSSGRERELLAHQFEELGYNNIQFAFRGSHHLFDEYVVLNDDVKFFSGIDDLSKYLDETRWQGPPGIDPISIESVAGPETVVAAAGAGLIRSGVRAAIADAIDAATVPIAGYGVNSVGRTSARQVRHWYRGRNAVG